MGDLELLLSITCACRSVHVMGNLRTYNNNHCDNNKNIFSFVSFVPTVRFIHSNISYITSVNCESLPMSTTYELIYHQLYGFFPPLIGFIDWVIVMGLAMRS